jgi:hypothetical protein
MERRGINYEKCLEAKVAKAADSVPNVTTRSVTKGRKKSQELNARIKHRHEKIASRPCTCKPKGLSRAEGNE